MPIDFTQVTPEEWDVARRAADQVNVHVLAHGRDAHGKYVAIRLSDGGSDGTLYDTRYDAVRHQLHSTLCAYARVTLDGTTPKKMWVFMVYMRQIYDNGGRLHEEDPRIPLLSERAGVISPRIARALRPGR